LNRHTERTQEYVLRWLAGHGQSFQEIIRKQWNFSAQGCIVGAVAVDLD